MGLRTGVGLHIGQAPQGLGGSAQTPRQQSRLEKLGSESALSTLEAEYVTATEAARETIWLREIAGEVH